MNFQEEYFSRHAIKSPIMKYVKDGNLILKSVVPGKVNPRWMLMTIKDAPEQAHPNKVIVSKMNPKPNSYSLVSSHGFKAIFSTSNQEANYDVTYQNVINENIKKALNNNYRPIFGLSEAKLCMLEMFVSIWSGYLLECFKGTIINDYYSVLDKRRSDDEKMNYFDKIDNMFLESNSNLRDNWREFKKFSHPETYCTWLKTWF